MDAVARGPYALDVGHHATIDHDGARSLTRAPAHAELADGTDTDGKQHDVGRDVEARSADERRNDPSPCFRFARRSDHIRPSPRARSS